MADGVVGRGPELEILTRFRQDLPAGPVGLIMEGEGGMGKPALGGVGGAAARARGGTVLASPPAESEAAFPFAALADLLEPVPPAIFERLPPPQRAALD